MTVHIEVSNKFWIAANVVILLGMLVTIDVSRAATWTGAGSDSWGSGTNWAPSGIGVPDTNTETAIISVNPDPDFNIDYTIGELTISSNGDLDLIGHRLIVQDIGGLSGTTILTGPGSGLSAKLTVKNSTHVVDFDTDYLEINANGELFITGAGAIAQVDKDADVYDGGLVTLRDGGEFEVGGALLISNAGEISGTGAIEITGSSDIHNSGTISALSGDLTISRSNSSTGEFNWDGSGSDNAALTVYSLNSMIIDIPIDSNGGDEFNGTITVNQGSEFQVNNPWGLGEGTVGVVDQAIMNLNGGGSGPATVSGSGAFTVNRSDTEIHVTSIFGVPGTAVIESNMTVHEGTVIVETDSTLQLDGTATFQAASNLDLNHAKALIINGTTVVNQSVIDLDGDDFGSNTITIGNGATLTLNVDAIDDDIVDSFGGTLNVNSGTLNANVDGGWESDGRVNIDTSISEAFINQFFYSNAKLTVDGGGPSDGIYVTGGAHRAWIKGDVLFTNQAKVDVAASSILQLYTTTTELQGGSWTGAGTVRFDGETTTVSAPTTMNVSVVDLNGTIHGGLGDALILDDVLTLQVDAIDSAGSNVYGGTGETMQINPAGHLDIQLNAPGDSWVMDATMNLYGIVGIGTSHHLDGADFEARGTTNVSGNTLWTARVDVTGDINIAANGKVKLLGGDWVNRNTITGGTISGSGKLALEGVRALAGHGTISAPIEFTGDSARLTADGGILTINGDLLDIGIFGTFSASGILDVTNPWNTGVVQTRVENNGGTIRGATITNDGLIEGYGSITSDGMVNNGEIRANGGTLILDSATNLYDLDGAANDGVLNAVVGSLDVREGDVVFEGTLNVAKGRSFIVDGNLTISDDTGPGLAHLTGGTIVAASDVDFSGTLTVDTIPSRIVTGLADPISYVRFLAGSHTTINTDLTLEPSYGSSIYSSATIGGTGRLINPDGLALFIFEGVDVDLTLHNEGMLVMGYGVPLVTGVMAAERYVQTATGQLIIQIVGTHSGEWDEMFVDTTATLDGMLRVQLDDDGSGSPYEPMAGDSWEIISTGGGVIGQFTSGDYSLAALTERLFWHVEYDTLGDRVVLHVLEYLDADFDEDNDVDQDDLDAWETGFGTIAAAEHGDGDADGDGDVDGADFLTWQRQLGSTAISSPMMAIPEPASSVLLLAGLAIVWVQWGWYNGAMPQNLFNLFAGKLLR